MSEDSTSTNIDTASAVAITNAGIQASISLANGSQPNPAPSIMRPESPIVIPDDNYTDLSADDQAATGNLDADAGNNPADADQRTPDNSNDAGKPAAATDAAQQVAPSQPVAIPTFEGLLEAINYCKGDYRKIHTKLFIALYTAWLAFRDAPKADKAANQKALDDKCKELGIKATTNRLKLAQLAFGKNAQRASAKARVIKTAENLGIEPDAVGKWLEDNGGFEAVRTTLNTDGTKKEDNSQPKSAQAPKAKAKADVEASYIEKAKAALATDVKATIPAGQLDQIDQDAECTAILRQQADGSFAVIAVLNDSKLVKAAYAAHGRML